jgi:hypothetical protein
MRCAGMIQSVVPKEFGKVLCRDSGRLAAQLDRRIAHTPASEDVLGDHGGNGERERRTGRDDHSNDLATQHHRASRIALVDRAGDADQSCLAPGDLSSAHCPCTAGARETDGYE